MKFLRYPGGKGKLLNFLVKYLPTEQHLAGTYWEPFLGGGSIFLHLNPHHAVLSDINHDLIELYKGIKNYPHKVWAMFNNFPGGKLAYYKIRDNEYKNRPLYYRAARTLYLNRTCFKGMWRHNPQGQFNVGYGGDRRWNISHDNIIDLSHRLKKATIQSCDFETILDNCENGDFVFLDPPYRPGEKEMSHAHYVHGRFTYKDQERLASKVKEISSKKKIAWLMTNSSHRSIRKLYKGFKVRKIPRGTSNRVGALTNDSKEILISNY